MNQPTPAQFDIILPAMRLGFARAAAQAGLAPSEAEAKLASLNKEGGSSIWDALHAAVENSFVAAGAIGAIGGGLSGILRHKVEQKLDGKDDPAIQTDEEKAKGYERMSEDLKRNMAANATAPTFVAPRVQEAMR